MINIPDQTWIVEKYGKDQYNIAMEECAELIQAINKNLRYENTESRRDMIEEMADVYICLEQLKLLADIDEFEINTMIVNKTERTNERYGENKI